MARIELKEYMNIRGIKDVKEARKQVERDLDALDRIEFEIREKRKGVESKNWIKIKLSGGTKAIKNSVIYFRFNTDYYNCLPERQFMYLPQESFTFNDKRNPHSYYFIRQISVHKRMNIGRVNENMLSVKTMLESSPLLPKYEDVKNREYHRYIIQPFERDMDNITAFKWQYKEGQPSNYDEFIKSHIEIIWEVYPDTKKLESNKKKYEKQKKERKTQAKKLKDLEHQIQALSAKVGN